MSQQEPDTRDFDRFLRGAHMPAHARRTARANAAFLLPHLRLGMRLLDAGCGPGSITTGLARAIAPGDAMGIDASADAIDAARAHAAAVGCTNVRFEVSDVYDLPFEDVSFDAVFAHALLQHLSDPLAALRELRRVLRPGGVIAVADADHDGSIIAPQDPLIERSFEIARLVRARSGGGDPRVGKRLRGLLHDAGFERATASGSAAYQGAADAVRLTGEFQARYFEAPEFGTQAERLGVADAASLGAIAAAWRAWSRQPGAFWARFWCEAVAWAPR